MILRVLGLQVHSIGLFSLLPNAKIWVVSTLHGSADVRRQHPAIFAARISPGHQVAGRAGVVGHGPMGIHGGL